MEPLDLDDCTLPSAERPLRLAEFDALFRDEVRHVEWIGDEVRLHLSGAPGLADRVRDLAAREGQCCSFFTFTLHGSDEALEVTISVPAEQAHVLEGLARRAESLST